MPVSIEGQAVRAVPCLILLACLFATGCQSSGSKQAGAGGANSPFLDGGAGNKPGAPIDPIFNPTGMSDDERGGMLAGQVLDGLTGRPVSANIRWVCLDEAKEDAAPIDVATTPAGFFTIQGLKPGKHYKLVVQAKTGERTLTGVVQTVTPNPRLVITVKDDLTPASAPAPPPRSKKGKDGDSGGFESDQSGGLGTGERPAVAQMPGWAPTVAPVTVPQPSSPKASGIRQPVPMLPGQDASPAWGTIPPPPPPPDLSRIAVAEGPKVPPASIQPAPVPSCVLVGERLVNFALRDVNGRRWEYQTHKSGKLMLLDFWFTACQPCLQSIPHLRHLKQRYATAGLEVVTIAYEGGTLSDQARAVRAAAEKHLINYTLLLGSGKQCPVRMQFNVVNYPTLFLLDENGRILWRHEGMMQSIQLEQLERKIRIELGIN